MKSILLLAIALFIVVNSVQADNFCLSADAGLHYSQMELTDVKDESRLTLNMFLVTIDCYLSENFALEVRMGWRMSDRENEVSLDSIQSFYGKFILFDFEKVNVYGLAGGTYGIFSPPNFEIDASPNSTITSLSYAFGFEVNLYKNTYLIVEYVDYLSYSDINMAAIEFGLNLKM